MGPRIPGGRGWWATTFGDARYGAGLAAYDPSGMTPDETPGPVEPGRYRASLIYLRGPEEFAPFRYLPGGKMNDAGNASWPLIGVEIVRVGEIVIRVPLLMRWAVGRGTGRIRIRGEEVSRVDCPTLRVVGLSVRRPGCWEYYRMSSPSPGLASAIARALSQERM